MYQRPSKASIASGTRRNYNPTYLPSPPSSPYSQQQRRRLRSRFCWFSGMRGRREIILSLLICISVGFFLMQGIFWTTHIFFSPTSHDLIIPIPPEHDNLPLLFIGGSDGSGTRAFVRVLQQLGVVVTYDDATTFDVHGAEMFQKQGWPGLVNNVLRITHSGNYNFTDLPLDTQLICEREVAQFMKRKFRLYKRKTQLMQQQQHSHSFWNSRPPFPPIVTEVSFAMKAPVSMLVLPVLTKVAGKIKFLHVLRDGRDVALSSNQSPVVKFYNTTYEDYQERSEKWKGDLRYVRAMQLWNDWNLQVREWAMTNPDKVDYLAIRSEDLLQHPTWAWQALAKFVGSQLSPKQICCKARKDLKDLGLSATQNEQQNNFFDQQLNGAVVRASPHGAVVRASPHGAVVRASPSSQNEELRLLDEKYQEMEQLVSKLQQRKKELVALDLSLKQREESLQKLEQSLKELESHHRGRRRLTESVEKRYGKWTSILANQKLLKKYLHQEGAKALHVFRYNPFRDFMDPSQYNDTLCEDADHQQYQCS